MLVHVNAFSIFSFRRRANTIWGLISRQLIIAKIMSPLCVCILALAPIFSFASMVNQPVSVFSTYPSETLIKACDAQQKLNESDINSTAIAEHCFEDAISPDSFIKVLLESGEFSNLLPYGEGNDYELLIANVGSAPSIHLI